MDRYVAVRRKQIITVEPTPHMRWRQDNSSRPSDEQRHRSAKSLAPAAATVIHLNASSITYRPSCSSAVPYGQYASASYAGVRQSDNHINGRIGLWPCAQLTNP